MKAKNPQRWFIYRMRCLIDGVGDYVGMTHNPFQREREHRKGNRKGKLAAAIHLYGEMNFVYEIIDECETEARARVLEHRYIQKLGTGWPRGLNIVHAGKGAYAYQYDKRRKAQIKAWADDERRRSHSEKLKRVLSKKSTRQLMSESAKERWARPEYRAKQAASSTGKKHTEETKQKLREMKLAASAARGGPKGRPKPKYPGLSASEIAKANHARPEVREKTRATWWSNPKNLEKARAQAAVINSNPVLSARRIAALRKAKAENPRAPASAETKAKMSAAHTARWARIKALQNPIGSA